MWPNTSHLSRRPSAPTTLCDMGKRLVGAQLDQDFIDQIDLAAKSLGMNRSTFIRQALEQLIASCTPTA